MEKIISHINKDCVVDHGPSNLLIKDVDCRTNGFRMSRISGYGKEYPLFAAVWQNEDGYDYTFTTDMTRSEFQKVLENLKNNGYFLRCIDGYELNGEANYAAIWEKNRGIDYMSRHGLTAAQFNAVCIDYSSRGFRPIHVSIYTVEGKTEYAAIWVKEEGPNATIKYEMSQTDLEITTLEFEKAGYRLTDLNACFNDDRPSFAAIYEQSNGVGIKFNSDLNPDRFFETRKLMEAKGYRASNISGYNTREEQNFAVIWTRSNNH